MKPVSTIDLAVGCLISVLVLSPTLVGQRPVPHNKPTERVVTRYLDLVEEGALLTPDGWEKASTLFVESGSFLNDGDIHLMSVGGSLGEMWVKDGRAMVETKWTDDFGTIDSRLRYRPRENPNVTMTVFLFELELTDKHWEIAGDGALKSESNGQLGWKIVGPMRRETTVENAIVYLTKRATETSDPLIKKNADRTIAALRRLSRACGSASAC